MGQKASCSIFTADDIQWVTERRRFASKRGPCIEVRNSKFFVNSPICDRKARAADCAAAAAAPHLQTSYFLAAAVDLACASVDLAWAAVDASWAFAECLRPSSW